MSDTSRTARLHPLPIRLMHWVNALAMLIMIGSGWGIYNDSVIINGLHVPEWLRLGSWAAKSLLWHFAFMWLLAVNGLLYLGYGLATGRFRRKLLPINPRELLQVTRDALRLHVAHEDLTRYNAVQRVLYIVAILAGIVQVVSGLAVWKPVQFAELMRIFGDFQGARLVHFAGMAVLVGFVVVHVALALLVPRTLQAMVTGGPLVDERA